jgi:hypothetical protein
MSDLRPSSSPHLYRRAGDGEDVVKLLDTEPKEDILAATKS